MPRDIIRTANAPAPPPTYSQAVRAAGLVFVSGTSPHDPATGKLAGDTIQEQTRQCLQNISAILEAAGTSLKRVVSATVIILEETDFGGWPIHKPTHNLGCPIHAVSLHEWAFVRKHEPAGGPYVKPTHNLGWRVAHT